MIKSEEEMDQYWRLRLKEAVVPPPAFVWPEIERNLQRKKRRMLLWWSSGLGALLLGGAAWYFSLPVAVPTEAIIADRFTPEEVTRSNEGKAFASPDYVQEGSHQAQIQKKWVVATVQNKLESAPVEVAGGPVLLTGEAQHQALDNRISTPAQGLGTSSFLQLRPLDLPVLTQVQRGQSSLPGWPSGVIRKRKEQTGECYDFSENRRAWLIEGYAGPLYASKLLETAGNPEQEPYRARRLATEGPGWGFNLGGRAAYLFSEKYLLSTGLDYQQFSEVFEYADPSSIEYIIKQVLDVSTNTLKIDTIDINFGEERTRVINRFGLLDLPLSMGHEWRAGRMGIRVEGGGAVNLFFWKRGAVLDPQTGVPGYFTAGNGTQTVFRTRAGLSWHAGVQWFWHIAPKTRLTIEPTFRQQVTPLTQIAHPLEQRYNNWSLRIGFSKII